MKKKYLVTKNFMTMQEGDKVYLDEVEASVLKDFIRPLKSYEERRETFLKHIVEKLDKVKEKLLKGEFDNEGLKGIVERYSHREFLVLDFKEESSKSDLLDEEGYEEEVVTFGESIALLKWLDERIALEKSENKEKTLKF